VVFGKRAGEFAAKFAKDHGAGSIDQAQVDEVARTSLEPFERQGESPYQVQHDLQDLMQDLVGIVRREDELERALDGIAKLKVRAAKVGIGGNREYNPGWHTALDLNNLLTVSEAVALAGLQRKESRGAHFRDDYPEKDATFGTFNFVITKGGDGAMKIDKELLPPMTDEQKQIIEEMK
jgi:succinate dehydrogenase / fumarate reductase, flavoprotein subunit